MRMVCPHFTNFVPDGRVKTAWWTKSTEKTKMWFPRQLFVIKLLFFPLTNASEMADVTTCEDKFNYLRQKLSP